jgi:RNA polymerase sigma-70 factor, ECF subfamily
MDATSDTWFGRAPGGWAVTVAGDDAALRAQDLEALDERELVRACVEDRPGAFDLLIARHSRAVYQLCYRFLGTHEDATDAAQEVFLRAFRALPRFKGESSVGTWLYRIAVNLCLNRRAVKPPPTEPLDDRDLAASAGPDAVGRLLQQERAARVRAAIAQLPDRQRAALILRVYHDLSHQEIARVLKSTEGAVKANFFHALRKLRALLAPGEESS